jgi:predicted RNA binding protein YcfA (HicA-like mRNA interferase family)
MKVREVIKRIETDGWIFARRGGRSSHRIYKKEGIPMEISISGEDGKEVSSGQLQDIRRKSGLALR